MDLRDRAVALYGRFSPGERDRLQREILSGGGVVARDLTGRSDAFVIGAMAAALIDSGALSARLHRARERNIPIFSEDAFAAAVAGEPSGSEATLALSTALAQTGLTRDDADLFAAFDLIGIDGENCRFGDAATLRTAGELVAQGRSRAEVVRILTRARERSPKGRHKVVLTPAGEAALQWQNGLTTLEGQGILAFDEDHASIDDLLEAAALAEASGDADQAAHLYDMCARADRSDAIAPFNYGNIRLAQGQHGDAALAYERALARDPRFTEARYNLAKALEAAGKTDAALIELNRVLDADPTHADAVFNLAQLRLQAGELAAATALYERYLRLDPPEEWAAKARKAILYCTSQAALR
jgi:tetratricopeptide (TPR) repeat protein